MSRELVVTADDLGLFAATNTAVAELAGVTALTAASLVTTGPVAERALALRLPLPVGVHVMLGPEVATLGDAEIETAIEAQVTWLLDRGHTPAHLDLHTVGLYGFGRHAVRGGGVVPQAIVVAARHRLALRLPRRPRLPGLGRERLELHRDHVRQADHLGVPLPETVLADMRPSVAGYRDLRDHVLALLADLPDGRSELVLHPQRPDPPRRDKPHWEAELLRTGALGHACTAAGITLTHW